MANSPTPATAPRNQPVQHEVRLGGIKAAIWQNQTEAGLRYNVTFERLYHQEGEWRSTTSFGRSTSFLLRKVADLAHSWIIEPDAAEAARLRGPAKTPRRISRANRCPNGRVRPRRRVIQTEHRRLQHPARPGFCGLNGMGVQR